MRPASGTVVRQDIADVLYEYSADLNGQFMGTEILPIFNSQVKSGQFPRLKVDNFKKATSNGKRAPGGKYDKVQSEFDMIDFTCAEYGLEENVDDGQAKQIASYFDAEVAAAKTTEFRIRRNQEIRAAAALFSASVFAGYTGGVTTEWNKAAGLPYSDIQDAIVTLKQQIGGVLQGEICLAVSDKVYRNICKTTEIKNMRKGGAGSTISMLPPSYDEIAAILGVNRVVSSAAQNAAVDIWDDEFALLFIRSMSQNLRETPQLGRTFVWVEDSPDNATVESYHSDEERSQIVRVRHHVVEKVLNVQAGYLLSNITE